MPIGLASIHRPARSALTGGELHLGERHQNLGAGLQVLRFEEGLATDTDVPNDFQRGMMEGSIPAPGHPNAVNVNTQYKHANETMAERAHVGSAAWVEAPEFLGAFASGAGEGNVIEYPEVTRSGAHYMRVNPALVQD